MQKIKKFVYPFVFSISFFATYIILAIVLEIVLPSGDYAGLVYAGFALIIWISVITPIYCIKYGQLIREKNCKFLFGFYNPLVITLCHAVPFISRASSSSLRVIISIAVFLFCWTAIWTFVPLLIRLDSTKKQDDNNSNEIKE